MIYWYCFLFLHIYIVFPFIALISFNILLREVVSLKSSSFKMDFYNSNYIINVNLIEFYIIRISCPRPKCCLEGWERR